MKSGSISSEIKDASTIYWVPRPLYSLFGGKTIRLLREKLKDCHSVLDLGCGFNSPIRFINVEYSLGIEMFEPYLNESKRKSLHSEYCQADIRSIDFKANTFDAVILLEVLEHLNKQEGLKLIINMQMWAKKKVIITVPNGFVSQDPYDENNLQEHKSGWSVKELSGLGFKVYGLGGIKQLHGYKGNIKYRPQIMWKSISFLAMPLLYYMPSHAFLLGAVWDKNDEHLKSR